MNKEYIKRDTAVVFLENMAASRYLIQCFEDKERFPAADVAPVVHGEWIPNEKMIRSPYARNWHCSVCGNSPIETSDYCGRCGAKMDGGNE